MIKTTIAFIGAGNMATSLISGLIADGIEPGLIWASNPHAEKCQQLENRFGIHVTSVNVEAAEQADVVIFAVKPKDIPICAGELSEAIQKKHPLVISIAAGVRIAHLDKLLGGEVAIVRCMPNMAALVGSGATGLFANGLVSDPQRDLAESILRAVGVALWLDQESDLDIVTALSGSGPAYFLLVMEALEDAAKEMGLADKTAHLLAVQTALGTAHMTLTAELDCAQLREQVTSPGGTTEAALKVLEDAGIRDIFATALKAAAQRSRELAQ